MLSGENGNAYNISADSGEWYMRELADMIASHAGKKLYLICQMKKKNRIFNCYQSIAG